MPAEAQRLVAGLRFDLIVIGGNGHDDDALPLWPYGGGWGYYPSGGLGLLVLILAILLLTGRV